MLGRHRARRRTDYLALSTLHPISVDRETDTRVKRSCTQQPRHQLLRRQKRQLKRNQGRNCERSILRQMRPTMGRSMWIPRTLSTMSSTTTLPMHQSMLYSFMVVLVPAASPIMRDFFRQTTIVSLCWTREDAAEVRQKGELPTTRSHIWCRI